MRKILSYFTIGILTIFGFLLLIGGVYGYMTLYVPGKEVVPIPLTPALLDGTPDRSAWEKQKPALLKIFEDEVYGPIPTTPISWNIEKTILQDKAYNGTAAYELWALTSPDTSITVHAVLLIPKKETPVPFVVASSFCPNHLKFPQFAIPKPLYYPSMCEGGGMNDWLSHFIFGNYIDTYPFEEFVARDTALASIYLAEVVPDEATLAKGAFQKVSEATGTDVSGTLAAWAWVYLEVARVIESDLRFDAKKTALYGHSRDGKAVLLAGAVSAIPDLLLVHQSGKGGAAPWQLQTGESIQNITERYPHWFSPRFNAYIEKETSLPFDQHQLLALLAPRPVLITGGRLDKWDDPKGSLHAARAASEVYALYGKAGPSEKLEEYLPEHTLSFFMRPWFHGVQPADWSAFFAFLEAQF